jgi:DNA-directed RNA polymerase subunit RPC12/RpoP
MPHFSPDGNDTYICQKCARIYDSVHHPSTWVKGKGNVCPTCINPAPRPYDGPMGIFEDMDKPISLHEHCRRESGLTGVALERYINRHYGHN